MSSMEFFIGTFEKAPDQSIVPKDEDDFYDLEEADKCYYIRVGETLYKAWPIVTVEEYDFTEALPVISTPILICYWYNGGAGVHEVVEVAIEKYLKENPEPVDELTQVLQDGGFEVINMSRPSVRDGSTWECKIGIAPGTSVTLPGGSDLPMRKAVEAAFVQVTNQEPEYCLSGWGAELIKGEKEALT